MTNDELDQAIADAQASLQDAWETQSAICSESGYDAAPLAASATRQALEAELYYRALLNEQRRRDIVRVAVGQAMKEANAIPCYWSNVGPWSFVLRGKKRFAHMSNIKHVMKQYGIPYRVDLQTACSPDLVITYWRPAFIATSIHSISLTQSLSISDLTPFSPQSLPAKSLWEGERYANVQTTRVAEHAQRGAG